MFDTFTQTILEEGAKDAGRTLPLSEPCGARHVFPFLRLAGSYREIGQQYGQAARGMIRREACDAIPIKARETGLKTADIYRQLDRFRRDYQRYAPRILEEIEGIAAGAGIAAETALFLRCRWDLVAPQRAVYEGSGCTAFAVAPVRTSQGRLIAGQNKDVPRSRMSAVVILEIRPTGGAPASLNYAYAGMCEGPGFNSAGLARFENSLFLRMAPTDSVPSHLLKRLFSEAASIAECVDWVRRIHSDGRLGLTGSMLFGERSGRVAAIEFAPGDFRVVEATDGLLGHANDPLHPDFKPFDRSFADLEWWDSHRRTARMHTLLHAGGNRLDVSYLQGCLSDHDRRPHSICRHRRGMRTIASLICVPEENVLWVCRGYPCRHPYEAYRMINRENG